MGNDFPGLAGPRTSTIAAAGSGELPVVEAEGAEGVEGRREGARGEVLGEGELILVAVVHIGGQLRVAGVVEDGADLLEGLLELLLEDVLAKGGGGGSGPRVAEPELAPRSPVAVEPLLGPHPLLPLLTLGQRRRLLLAQHGRQLPSATVSLRALSALKDVSSKRNSTTRTRV